MEEKNLYIWEINSIELELDMEDADTAERYSSALGILKEVDEIKNTDVDYVSSIRQYCAIFRKFYDFLFGDGTSAKIFADIKDNTRKYDEVYESFLDFIRILRPCIDFALSKTFIVSIRFRNIRLII